jgi:hypothetical protein
VNERGERELTVTVEDESHRRVPVGMGEILE